jgi:hypothetical protein
LARVPLKIDHLLNWYWLVQVSVKTVRAVIAAGLLVEFVGMARGGLQRGLDLRLEVVPTGSG